MSKFDCIKVVVLIVANLLLGSQGGFLLNPTTPVDKKLPCCDGEQIVSCQQVKLDPSVLGNTELEIKQLDVKYNLVESRNEEFKIYYYKNKNADLNLNYNSVTGGVYAYGSLNNGSDFTIEYCGDDIHVIKRMDFSNIRDDDPIDAKPDDSQDNFAPDISQSDSKTIANYSIKFYYTPEFATNNVNQYVDILINELNKGYINSKVYMRAHVHCIEPATINDVGTADDILQKFRSMKQSKNNDPVTNNQNLRGSADIAFLLVKSYPDSPRICGMAYMTLGLGITLGSARYNCIQSVPHEIGHIVGLHHNREALKNIPNSGDGYGYLIGKDYYTYMAYQQYPGSRRISYFSNPDVIHPESGQPTGELKIANSARYLNERRFELSSLGDESIKCRDAATTKVSTAASTTIISTPTTSSSRTIETTSTLSTTNTNVPTETCYVDNASIYFRQQVKFGISSEAECLSSCRNSSTCSIWEWTLRKINWWTPQIYICKHIVSVTESSNDFAYGPDQSNENCLINVTNCIEKFAAYFNHRYIKFIYTRTIEKCEKACKLEPKCQLWTLDKNSQLCGLATVKSYPDNNGSFGLKWC